ncbi:phage portal protein [Rhizobium sullae]|uniref:HK97 family phage portal protein n=1 Tax=Rhizobium sullae TaxID=50338 RepID=A0A4R3QBD1_RHISU|nr:phage portal protein [Rhizobium sullae]TCU18798.1 HK97 family phage portal protein [Rhizobium sullae]
MGLIQRIADLVGYEKREAGNLASWSALAPGIGYYAGMSARAAENLSTVLGCVNAIATALAYVPVVVYRRESDGVRVEVTSHPLCRIVRSGANDQMTWPDFLEHLIASTLLTGNGLAVILRGGNGQLSGFRYVPWGMVTVAELSSGRLAYDVSDGRGNTRRYLEGEVLHLRDRTDDGKIGRSRLSRAADTVNGVQAANTHAWAFLNNGAFPSGVLEHPERMSTEAYERLRTAWNQRHSGPENAGKTPILEEGAKWNSSQISPEDTELLETRKFGVIELCRLFQVPPPIVQAYENNTFTNASQAGLWFGTFCLSPWARKIEAEFIRSVFPSAGPYEMELDLSGFLRGDPETRWNAHKIAIETGVLDADEVRQIEGWNPRKVGTAAPKTDEAQ